MLKTARAAALAAAALLAVAIPLFAGASGPYQETGAQIMERQRIADSPAGPRPMKPRWTAPRRSLSLSRLLPPAPPASRAPAAAAALAEPQTLGVNFLGANLADGNTYPPDTTGAVGPTQFLVGINGRLRTFDKTTGLADGILAADLDVFFNSVRNGQSTTEPNVRYDRISGRWFVTVVNFGATFTNNRVLIAVSSSGTISIGTIWTFSYFQHNLDTPTGDTNLFFDDPTLSVDANALVIGGNIFDSTGVFAGTTAHVVRKSAVLTGGGNLTPGSAVAYRNLTGTPDGAGVYAPRGVDNFADAAPTASWVLGVNNVLPVTSELVFRKIAFSAPGAWPPSSISADLTLSVPTTALPLSVPHLGNTGGADGQLDAVDDRLFAATLRGGHVWTAHNIAVDATGAGSDSGDRDGSRWYEIDVTGASPALVQSGTLFDAAAADPRFYWIPTIMVSGQGHAAIGSSAAGATEYANAVTSGRLASDAAGTLQSPLLFTASTTSYNPPSDPGPIRRWGDYSYTSLDPNDDMTMWTIQEYCNLTDSYGVRVVQLLAPAPATPETATPSSIASGLASVSVEITGVSAGGSGFFDPGAGFSNRLGASVPGVIVNGVSFTSPTSITLDLNTVGAAFGPRTVTITNPDGQSRTSSAPILTLGPGGAGPTVLSIAPSSGDADTAAAVEITGTDFVTGASVTIGGLPATGVTVPNATTADATTPALSPGTLNDVTLVNPDTQSGTLFAAWFADFVDVPQADIFHASVEKIFRAAITAGCSAGTYCRDGSVTRAQMAVFLLKSKFGAGHVPPACTGIFGDVACPSLFADWVEQLYAGGITGGCQASPLLYCPDSPVTRAQMATFLLKASLGSSYAPPNCTGLVFDDVPCTGGAFDPWIEDLSARGVTGGCGSGAYCPDAPNTRGQMAVFLVKAFSLP
jgi:hypothetical protein